MIPRRWLSYLGAAVVLASALNQCYGWLPLDVWGALTAFITTIGAASQFTDAHVAEKEEP